MSHNRPPRLLILAIAIIIIDLIGDILASLVFCALQDIQRGLVALVPSLVATTARGFRPGLVTSHMPMLPMPSFCGALSTASTAAVES